MSTKLYEEYIENGIITYEDFLEDPEDNQNKVILVRNYDFVNGTLRIKYPCAIKLIEDIIFDPIGEDKNNIYCDPENSKDPENYQNKSFQFGFHTAISVESDYVVIDLNGKRISQGLRHFNLQPVYSHITLNTCPVSNNNTLDRYFIDSSVQSDYCIIMNGKLGLSSGYGVSGIGNSNILLENLEIKSFRLAALYFKCITHSGFDRIFIDGSDNQIYVNNKFRNMTLLRRCCKMMIRSATKAEALTDLTNRLNKCNKIIDTVLNDIFNFGKVDEKRSDTKIFIPVSSKESLCFGIFIHCQKDEEDKYISDCINIENCYIKGIKSEYRPEKYLKDQIDSVGYPLLIKSVFNEQGKYIGNHLSNLQLCISRWANPDVEGSDPHLFYYRSDLDPRLVNKVGTLPTFEIKDYHIPTFSQGAYGIYASSINNLKIKAKVKKILNSSPKSNCSNLSPASSYGIFVAECLDARIKHCCVSRCYSRSGSAYGITFAGSEKSLCKNCDVYWIIANSSKISNECFSRSVGILVNDSSKYTILHTNKVEKIENKGLIGSNFKYLLDNDDVVLFNDTSVFDRFKEIFEA